MEITIKNTSADKKIRNLKYRVAYFKNNEIVSVYKYGEIEDLDDFEEILPNGEFKFIQECTYFNNVNDYGNIDFDNFELLVTEIQWK